MIRHGNKALGLALVPALFLSVAPAFADLGGIGSPVQGEAPAQADDADNIAQAQAQAQAQADAEAAASNEQYKKAIAAIRSGEAPADSPDYLGQDSKSQDASGATNPAGAVMIIRYNQQYVYYDNPLRKVVYKVAATKPEARYDLESVIPRDSKAFETDKYSQNLQNVVNVLAKYGVSGNRVSTRVIPSDSVKYQEINIFVR